MVFFFPTYSSVDFTAAEALNLTKTAQYFEIFGSRFADEPKGSRHLNTPTRFFGMVEILSPGNIRKEIKDKYDLYEATGIPEYWLIPPTEQTILAYKLDDIGKQTGPDPIALAMKSVRFVFLIFLYGLWIPFTNRRLCLHPPVPKSQSHKVTKSPSHKVPKSHSPIAPNPHS